MEKKLGEGGFGFVFRGKDKSPGESRAPRECAAKKVSLADTLDRESFENELTVLQAISGHQSIIELFGHLQSGADGWLFLEMATGGELFDRLIDSGQLSERAAWPYAAAIASAVRHCHARAIMHRDIKLENVMLCADDPHAIRLIDFGLAYQMKLASDGSIVDERVKDTAGTEAYRAPEISASSGYSPLKVDVWAFGIVLFSLVSGFFPLQEAKEHDWRYQRLARDQASGVGACESIYRTYKRTCPFSAPLRTLLDAMLCIDQAARISVDGLAESEWLKTEPAGPSGQDGQGAEDGPVYRSLEGAFDDDVLMDEVPLDDEMVRPARQKAARR